MGIYQHLLKFLRPKPKEAPFVAKQPEEAHPNRDHSPEDLVTPAQTRPQVTSTQNIPHSPTSLDKTERAIVIPVLDDNLIKFLNSKEYGQSEERDLLWETYEPLLKRMGYEIAWDGDIKHESDHLPATENPWQPESGKSFAFASVGRQGVRWAGPSYWPSLCGAYDKENRFVVIKLVATNSQELKIITTLNGDPNEKRDPRNHTIPVLEFIPANDYTLIIMPSWELSITNGYPCFYCKDYVQSAYQCLEGLDYMHTLGISHGDIYPLNIQINHVTHAHDQTKDPRHLFGQFSPQFAYIDFGCSRQFPTGTPRSLPSDKVPLTYAQVPEIKSQLTYDPMPADVYRLAATLKDQIESDRKWCHRVWNMKQCAADRLKDEIPDYLKILEQMMVEDPSQRLSAAQAFLSMQKLWSRFDNHVLDPK